MPLYSLSAQDAIATRKNNQFAGWGSRNTVNRVEPLASPHFDLPFSIEPGESIFTIGSCFARNVETKLAKYGFRLPMREVLQQPELEGIDIGALNNFSTPSIYNELAWGVGVKPYDEHLSLVEVGEDKWLDLNVIARIRPDREAVVKARREAMRQAYGSFVDCGLVIMTLGLIEIWYDKDAQDYINGMPTPGVLRKYPDRFELHVLDYEETIAHLDKAIRLILEHGRPDVKILISVSPVPLSATHRNADVMVASAYSKATLRSAAEAIVARFDQATYYPSYESVTHSSRTVAWEDDFIHVTDRVVAHNVGRLVEALVGKDAMEEEALDASESPEAVIAAARQVNANNPAQARQFFEQHAAFALQSEDFASEYLDFLLRETQLDEAIALGEKINPRTEQVLMKLVEAYRLKRRPDDIIRLLEPRTSDYRYSARYWDRLITAAGEIGDRDLVVNYLTKFLAAIPRLSYRAYSLSAQALARMGQFAEAADLARQSIALEPDNDMARLALAQSLAGLGQLDEAETAVGSISGDVPFYKQRAALLSEEIRGRRQEA